MLLRFSEQESISLNYCHDRGIPWATRGARRWTERDLLRVNQVVLRVDDALGCRSQTVAAEIEPYFQDHQSEFDTATVAMILYRENAAAQLDIDKISRGELSFYAAAERSLLDAEIEWYWGNAQQTDEEPG